MQARAAGIATKESAERRLHDVRVAPRSLRVALPSVVGVPAMGQARACAAAPRAGGARRRLHLVRARLPAERCAQAADAAHRRRYVFYLASAAQRLRTSRAPARRRGTARRARPPARRTGGRAGAAGSAP